MNTNASEPIADIRALAQKEQQPLLDTLRDLVSMESGSKDVEGLNLIAGRVADQLKRIGGTVEILQPTDIYRLDDTPDKIGPAVQINSIVPRLYLTTRMIMDRRPAS